MMKNKKKGFTLVELLAVIVILAIILVIAVPQIMKTIEEARKGALVSSAKMIAASAETMYLSNTTLGISSAITCDDVAEINDTDYASCSITFDDNGKAKVSIVGKGKFDGMSVCSGTRENAVVTDEACSTNASCFGYTTTEKTYTVKDYDSCVSYLRPKLVDEWGESEEDLSSLCNGEVTWAGTFSENIQDMIDYEAFTEEELVENNVINVDESGIEITGYDASCGTDVIIPSTIDGSKVISIRENAFTTCGTVSDISLTNYKYDVNKLVNTYSNVTPVPITTNCVGLGITSVEFPDTIEYINSSAFQGNSIKNITFPKNLKEIGDFAFRYNNIDGELDLSEMTNLTTIGDRAFRDNNITSVILPKSLTFVGVRAFSGNSLSNVYLGNTNAEIGCEAFGDSTTIETHNLPETYGVCPAD